jgi:hypothetical protein
MARENSGPSFVITGIRRHCRFRSIAEILANALDEGKVTSLDTGKGYLVAALNPGGHPRQRAEPGEKIFKRSRIGEICCLGRDCKP